MSNTTHRDTESIYTNQFCALTLKPFTDSLQANRPITNYITDSLLTNGPITNREYLVPKIPNMNNRFHSEAKLPWSYDHPLANHIATNKSSANREMPQFLRRYPSFGYLRKIFPAKGFKMLPISFPK